MTFSGCPAIGGIKRASWNHLNLRQGAGTLAHWTFLFLLPFIFFLTNLWFIFFMGQKDGGVGAIHDLEGFCLTRKHEAGHLQNCKTLLLFRQKKFHADYL